MNRECPVLHSDAALTPWTKVHHRIEGDNPPTSWPWPGNMTTAPRKHELIRIARRPWRWMPRHAHSQILYVLYAQVFARHTPRRVALSY